MLNQLHDTVAEMFHISAGHISWWKINKCFERDLSNMLFIVFVFAFYQIDLFLLQKAANGKELVSLKAYQSLVWLNDEVNYWICSKLFVVTIAYELTVAFAKISG